MLYTYDEIDIDYDSLLVPNPPTDVSWIWLPDAVIEARRKAKQEAEEQARLAALPEDHKIILVPADMQLDLTGTVDIGQIDLPSSKPTEGDDLNVDTTVKPLAEGQPAYIVTIDAAIGAGNLEVRREAA